MVNQETLRRSQNSFSGGEIGAKVLGRVDLAKFNTGMRYAMNVFVEVEGAYSNRAGFRVGGRTRFDSGIIRFQPFEAPGEVSYVIEITDQRFRFYYQLGLVRDNSNVVVEVVTPYLAADLYKMVFSQTNDIMTITCAGYAPQELRRTAFNAFNLQGITVNPSPIAPPSPTINDNGGGANQTDQYYCVSSVDANGIEGLPSITLTKENSLTAANTWVEVQWNEVAGADSYIVYKKRAGQFGFAGQIRQENYETIGPPRTYKMVDNNINPNTAQTPKRLENPFPTAQDYPAISFIYGQRRAFAATFNKPNSIINSQTGSFAGFARSVPAVPDDYFEFALGAARTQQIKHVMALDDLIIFTASTEWRLSASGGYAATQPPDVRPQSNIGIGDVPPLLVGTDIFFLQAFGRTVYRMNFSFDFNKFMSDDISVLSKHLFKGRSIVSWCYLQEPHFIVFAVLSDGEAVMLTYNREQQVYGYTRCATKGFFEACCSIREGGMDRLYVAVRRMVGGSYKRFFERLATREITSVFDSFFVDCGVTQNSPVSITDISGGVITAPAHGKAPGTEIRVYDVVGTDADGVLWDINTRYKVYSSTTNTLVLADWDTGLPVDIDSFVYRSGGTIRTLLYTVTNLTHLEGEKVSVLADGVVYLDQVVSGGQVALPFGAGILTAGLPYESEVHSLELESEEQPTRGRQKTVANLVIRLLETRGIELGLSMSTLREIPERMYEDYPDPVNPGSKIVRLPMEAGWNDEVKVILRQKQPLPLTVLSYIPEYGFGD